MLRTAIELADRDGLDSLSMRKLGSELGVEAMSLYNHVAHKDDLLDGLADIVIGEVQLPTDGHRLEDCDASASHLGSPDVGPPPLGRRRDRFQDQPKLDPASTTQMPSSEAFAP